MIAFEVKIGKVARKVLRGEENSSKARVPKFRTVSLLEEFEGELDLKISAGDLVEISRKLFAKAYGR